MVRKFQIEPGAYFAAAAGFLLLPLPLLGAIATAVVTHELAHFLSAKCMGIQVYSLRISAGGCIMETQAMTRWQELICAAAGPVSSLCLLFLGRWMPMTALCGAIQGLYNLLPISSLDGGRILSCAMYLLAEEKADEICLLIENAAIWILVCGALYVGLRLDWAMIPAALVALGAVRIGKVKNSLQTGATQGTIDLPFLKR